jgi:hypothetical protein
VPQLLDREPELLDLSISNERETPYRRAVAATWRGACKLTRTILSFSSSDQSRLPTCVHHFEPFDLGTAPITVHNDSSQYRASFGKAVVGGRILLLMGIGSSCPFTCASTRCS